MIVLIKINQLVKIITIYLRFTIIENAKKRSENSIRESIDTVKIISLRNRKFESYSLVAREWLN